MPTLNRLPPGTRFREPDLGLTGTLLMVNECRARVRIDRPQRLVEFTGADGEPRTFHAGRNIETSWAPTVVVEALSFAPLTERDTMAATKKTSQQAPTKTTTKAKKADGKLSQLDAAVKVLEEAKEPMTTKAMIDAMAAKGYWTSPGGKTPHATLYAAIIREIAKKGAKARFQKTDRGLFTTSGGGTAAKASAKPKKTNEPADGAPGPKSLSDLFKL